MAQDTFLTGLSKFAKDVADIGKRAEAQKAAKAKAIQANKPRRTWTITVEDAGKSYEMDYTHTDPPDESVMTQLTDAVRRGMGVTRVQGQAPQPNIPGGLGEMTRAMGQPELPPIVPERGIRPPTAQEKARMALPASMQQAITPAAGSDGSVTIYDPFSAPKPVPIKKAPEALPFGTYDKRIEREALEKLDTATLLEMFKRGGKSNSDLKRTADVSNILQERAQGFLNGDQLDPNLKAYLDIVNRQMRPTGFGPVGDAIEGLAKGFVAGGVTSPLNASANLQRGLNDESAGGRNALNFGIAEFAGIVSGLGHYGGGLSSTARSGAKLALGAAEQQALKAIKASGYADDAAYELLAMAKNFVLNVKQPGGKAFKRDAKTLIRVANEIEQSKSRFSKAAAKEGSGFQYGNNPNPVYGMGQMTETPQMSAPRAAPDNGTLQVSVSPGSGAKTPSAIVHAASPGSDLPIGLANSQDYGYHTAITVPDANLDIIRQWAEFKNQFSQEQKEWLNTQLPDNPTDIQLRNFMERMGGGEIVSPSTLLSKTQEVYLWKQVGEDPRLHQYGWDGQKVFDDLRGKLNDSSLPAPRANAPDMPTNPQNVGTSPVGEAKTALHGKPITVEVYHGSADTRFTKQGEYSKPGSIYDGAVFFTDDPNIAKTYADDRRAFDYQNAEPGVIKRRVTLQNPKVIDAGGESWKNTRGQVAQAKAEGYDGLIIKNVRDAYSTLDNPNGYNKPATNVVVFDRAAIVEDAPSPVGEAVSGTLPTSPGTTSKGVESLLTNAERQAIYKQRDNPEALKSLIEYYTPHANDPKAAEIIRIANETMQGDAFKAARGQGDNLEEVLRQSIEKAQAAKRGATAVDPLDAELEAIRQRLKAKYAEPEPTSPVGDGVAVSEPVAPVAAPSKPKGFMGQTRAFMLGGQSGDRATMKFASEFQRDLYDARSQARGVGKDKSPDYTKLKDIARMRGITLNEAGDLASRVYDDVRSQMKGLGDGDHVDLLDNVSATPKSAEPVATPTTFTPRELSGYDAGTVPNLREGLKAAPEPVAPKPVPAKKAVPGKATKPVSVKGTAAKPVSEDATPNGGKLEDYGDARVIADKVDSAPVAMRRWLYGTKIPYKQNEIEAVRRWMHENNIPMDFEGQKWIDAPTRFMNAWRDHSNVRPIEEIGAIRPDVNDMRDRFRTDYKTVMGADVDGTPMWTDTHSIVVGTPPKGYSLQPDGAATPDLKRVWDSIVGSVGKSKPVKPVAFSKGAEHVKMALISDDGSVIVYVHPGKMKLVEALHPGVEWRAVSESRPIVGIVDGNPVAGIMPMAGSDIDAAVRSMVDASSPSKLQAIDSEIDALKAAQDAKNAKRPTPRKGGRSGAWQRVDAEDWELAGKLAVLYVKKGVATIEEFTANLVRDLGDAIRPHIQELWDAHGPKVKEAEPTGSGTTPPPTPSTATAGVPEPPKPKTALDFAKEASYVARGLKLGADVGALLRQGAEMAVNDPIQWVKSVGTGLSKTDKAKLAKHYQMLEERSINGNKMADVRKSAGLKTSSADAEEAFASKLFDKVPVLNKLENFQKAFLDSGRIERFDSFYRKFPDATEKELKQYAAYLNSAMGKSNVSRVPELLEVVMTAPRWTSSRWEMAGRLMASPVTVTKALRGNKAAMQEAKNLGRYAMAMYGALKVAESQGATVEFDPRSSDFLKMRVGEKVFDPTSGVAAPIRTSLRMMLFARGEGSFNANAATELGKVLTNTANPVITTPWGLITQKSLSGFDLDPEERGALVMLPLIANGAMQAWNKDGPASAMIQTGTELVGINSSRYPKSVPKWNKRKGEGTKAQQLLDKIPF